MKSLIVFTALFSVTSFASPLPQTIVQKLMEHHATGSANARTDVQPLKPIRQSQFKLSVDKSTIVKQPDGSYTGTGEKVCTAIISAPVFDARGVGSYSITIDQGASCASTMGGQPVSVRVNGAVVLDHKKLFEDEDARDSKSIAAWMGVENSSGAADPDDSRWSVISTPEMGATSLAGFMGASLVAPDQNVKEIFSATFESVDTP
jgi:hypothetical protein